MQAAARARQFGLLLAVVLVLLGLSTAVAPGRDGDGGPQRVSTTGDSASPAPSLHDDLQDWLRLSAGTPRAPATALPDTWWAVCPGTTGERARQGLLLVGAVDHTAMVTATPAQRSSRAPPFA